MKKVKTILIQVGCSKFRSVEFFSFKHRNVNMYKRWPGYFVVCITLQASKELFSSCFQGKKLHQVHILLEVKKGPKGKKYLQIPCQMFSVFWGYKRLAAFCTMYISAHNCVLCHQVPTYFVVVHNNIRDSPLSLLSGMPKNLLFRRNKTYVP